MDLERPPRKITRYRALIADLYHGKYEPLEGVFDSWDSAQEALKNHLKGGRRDSTVGDVGGYIEKVELNLAYEPHEDEFFDEEGEKEEK